jgi:hypothetical protein
MTVEEAIDKLTLFPVGATVKTVDANGNHVPIRFIFKASSEEQTVVIL